MDADVTLVLDFLNTVNIDEGTDVLRSTADWHAWAHQRNLTPDPLDEAAQARRALRAAVGEPARSEDGQPGQAGSEDGRSGQAGSEDGEPGRDEPGSGPLRIPVGISIDVVTRADPHLVADTAVGAVYTAALRLAVLGTWQRVKICPADDCLWAFYDESRNRSRTWCSMSVCGNRVKARTFRQRTSASDDAESTHG
ncbi:CGNR zinc finger domain-containing protein [Prauserella rugosa]|uniref:CGNR zinc finger domain-containing protein n=1 Tax=Prauserella rugosa TaxID=43354 RepID=UPI0004C36699|nr:CGNR zinc finger domain-containing protein [Prauserella rugosa]